MCRPSAEANLPLKLDGRGVEYNKVANAEFASIGRKAQYFDPHAPDVLKVTKDKVLTATQQAEFVNGDSAVLLFYQNSINIGLPRPVVQKVRVCAKLCHRPSSQVNSSFQFHST